ncbi:MAG: 2-oxoglutarate dehydrogenase complex dihydrolipoyllysine-residue succinyltransferase [Phycisphaerales bacterium]
MSVEITIPSPGESVTEVVLGPWMKASGSWVEKDESLVEIESDKVTLEVPAPESGVLTVAADEGAEMNVGDVIGSIDPGGTPTAGGGDDAKAGDAKAPAASNGAAAAAAPAAASSSSGDDAKATSVARKIAQEKGVDLAGIRGTGPSGRISKQDVLDASSGSAKPAAASPASGSASASAPASPPAQAAPAPGSRGVRREKMSKLRQRIAERLVEAQQTAAMLTTFNEVDMTAVMDLRKKYKEPFGEVHGVGLGFMSFFVKAVCSGLRQYQGINAYIVGNEFEYHDFCDISVAVGTPKGLVVPVIRNAEAMSFAEVEQTIKNLALRARDGKLTIDEMTGGTFTISNGGVYGSLCSTPILNPPQSGILGMHKIMKVPREDPDNPGTIALRPMMQLAVSYDHRIVDGEQAVRFLVHVKDRLEAPERLLFDI